MIAKQKQARLLFLSIALLLTLSLTIAGCGGTPIPKPQSTFALEVSPGMEVQVGQRVAIIAKIEPIEKLNLKWSVSGGDAEGKLNTYEGEQVIYIGGKEGIDFVTAEGTTASGVPVKQTVSLTVVGATETPVTPPLTPGDCNNFTSRKVSRQPLPPASSGATASFSLPQHCETGLPAGEALSSVGGTATNVPGGSFLWLLVHASDSNYYPQCNNALGGQCGANLSGGVWEVTTYLGRRGCKEHFHLVLVTMNQSDNDQLAQEMIQGAQTGDYGFTA